MDDDDEWKSFIGFQERRTSLKQYQEGVYWTALLIGLLEERENALIFF